MADPRERDAGALGDISASAVHGEFRTRAWKVKQAAQVAVQPLILLRNPWPVNNCLIRGSRLGAAAVSFHETQRACLAAGPSAYINCDRSLARKSRLKSGILDHAQ